MADSEFPVKAGFDEAVAGKRAECDGGGPIEGTYYAARHDFSGVLTGEYFDHGDPPWRWYLMTDLVKKPDGYPWDAVWCEWGNVYLIEE